jgi:hypothetical protein
MLKKLLPMVFLLAGFQANAALISSNDVYDDGNLEWLHFEFTHGNTAADSFAAFSGEGFRPATATEAISLINTWFNLSLSTIPSNSMWQDHSKDTLVDAWFAEFGNSNGGVEGYNSVGRVAGIGGFGTNAGDYMIANTWFDCGAEHLNYQHCALWMVRDTIPSNGVPEPSVIALFGLGLVGLDFARRRRKAQS